MIRKNILILLALVIGHGFCSLSDTETVDGNFHVSREARTFAELPPENREKAASNMNPLMNTVPSRNGNYRHDHRFLYDCQESDIYEECSESLSISGFPAEIRSTCPKLDIADGDFAGCSCTVTVNNQRCDSCTVCGNLTTQFDCSGIFDLGQCQRSCSGDLIGCEPSGAAAGNQIHLGWIVLASIGTLIAVL